MAAIYIVRSVFFRAGKINRLTVIVVLCYPDSEEGQKFKFKSQMPENGAGCAANMIIRAGIAVGLTTADWK